MEYCQNQLVLEDTVMKNTASKGKNQHQQRKLCLSNFQQVFDSVTKDGIKAVLCS